MQSLVRTAKTLKTIKKIYYTLNQNTSLGIYLINTEGYITYVNPTCCKLSGLSLKEALGMKWHKAVYDDDKDWLNKAWENDIGSKKVSRAEFRFRKPDGEIIWTKAESIPIWNSEKQFEGYIGILIDITKTKLYENQLDELKEVAKHSNKLKDEFIAQISHEIRTPINAIMLTISFIDDELNSNKNIEFQDAIISLKNAGNRIIRTIESLLQLAEIRANNFKVNPTIFNLFDVLQYSYYKYSRITKEKGLEFYLRTESSNLNITADEETVKVIFDNLIDNAIKFTKTGSVEIKVSEKDKKLVVSVADSGIGISEDSIQFIFEPFRQEDQGYSRSFDGIGLGLTLVKKYCELNNILIQVESKKNKGTKFTLILNQYLIQDL